MFLSILFSNKAISTAFTCFLFFCLIHHPGFAQSSVKNLLAKQTVNSRDFYIDNKNGNDEHSGLKPAEAWKSLAKVNTALFSPGDKIWFKKGQIWTGQLHPQGSGNLEHPIIINSYGYGNKPVIAGGGIGNGAVYFYNQSYWELHNLEITNYSSAEQEGLSIQSWENENIARFVRPVLPPQFLNQNTPKYGIFVSAKDAGCLHHIYLINLSIHGVNGYINQKDEQSKNNGGVYFEITGTSVPTWFDNLLIDSCNIHDVDRTGILLCKSSWDARSLTVNTNWVGSTNVVIRRCIFRNTGANALIVRVSIKPVIEHNLFDHCAIKASGNACFSFNCDSALWQYNECCYTKANISDVDAGGIDADYRSKNTLIQYNYSHDNDYGMLITGGPKSFNDGTVVRFNIFENDGSYAHPKHGKTVIRVNGSATNTQIYNNVCYLGKQQQDTKIVSHETWGASPIHTIYQNNIFYNVSKNVIFDLGESTYNFFDHNLYFGEALKTFPKDEGMVIADPLFTKPGIGPSGYKIKHKSPAELTGVQIKGNVKVDFYGNKISENGKNNLGIYNGPSF